MIQILVDIILKCFDRVKYYKISFWPYTSNIQRWALIGTDSLFTPAPSPLTPIYDLYRPTLTHFNLTWIHLRPFISEEPRIRLETFSLLPHCTHIAVLYIKPGLLSRSRSRPEPGYLAGAGAVILARLRLNLKYLFNNSRKLNGT